MASEHVILYQGQEASPPYLSALCPPIRAVRFSMKHLARDWYYACLVTEEKILVSIDGGKRFQLEPDTQTLLYFWQKDASPLVLDVGVPCIDPKALLLLQTTMPKAHFCVASPEFTLPALKLGEGLHLTLVTLTDNIEFKWVTRVCIPKSSPDYHEAVAGFSPVWEPGGSKLILGEKPGERGTCRIYTCYWGQPVYRTCNVSRETIRACVRSNSLPCMSAAVIKRSTNKRHIQPATTQVRARVVSSNSSGRNKNSETCEKPDKLKVSRTKIKTPEDVVLQNGTLSSSSPQMEVKEETAAGGVQVEIHQPVSARVLMHGCDDEESGGSSVLEKTLQKRDAVEQEFVDAPGGPQASLTGVGRKEPPRSLSLPSGERPATFKIGSPASESEPVNEESGSPIVGIISHGSMGKIEKGIAQLIEEGRQICPAEESPEDDGKGFRKTLRDTACQTDFYTDVFDRFYHPETVGKVKPTLLRNPLDDRLSPGSLKGILSDESDTAYEEASDISSHVSQSESFDSSDQLVAITSHAGHVLGNGCQDPRPHGYAAVITTQPNPCEQDDEAASGQNELEPRRVWTSILCPWCVGKVVFTCLAHEALQSWV